MPRFKSTRHTTYRGRQILQIGYVINVNNEVAKTLEGNDAWVRIDAVAAKAAPVAPAATGAPVPYAKMKKADLLVAASQKGITVPEGATNKDIVALLEATDAPGDDSQTGGEGDDSQTGSTDIG